MYTDKKKYSDIKKYCESFFSSDDFDKAFIKINGIFEDRNRRSY